MDSRNKKNIPPIPKGWRHIHGNIGNGFTVERLVDGSLFVWVPTCSIAKNGTVDRISFNKSFGARKFNETDLSNLKECSDSMSVSAINQQNSVDMYGGFYISKYPISLINRIKPVSLPDLKAITNVSWYDALRISSEFCDYLDHHVSAHLLLPSEYDSLKQWFNELGKSQATSKLVQFNTDLEWTQEVSISQDFAVVRSTDNTASRILFKKIRRNSQIGFHVALTIY